ncbi:acyl-CoA ligase (AMP-forming), exosortase A system-associated [Aporhodopirellula aestuarii]|uniref:Acyl-CoA ligase (AMP-forming), exosortase A system-associated n=1 Tax=Aporhodopirellula aestuarii TaxID=2950107 RepID=A0ABT0UE11_9BACT|nr:acyl-CoA ligase (AMP-forming), exosortase A system-associated [Aporhodopirellula aestuarii]MCM2375134.1 acyl-CoA ligase (AMP-forming), exosortase A system-associated [Aporhodopirellula aestuarii]
MRYLLHHLLDDSANRAPDREAIVDGTRRWDYQSFSQRVDSLAAGLQSAGIRRGDRVAIFLPPTASLPLAIFAASKCGGVFVPIHHSLFPPQVSHILNDSGAKLLITDDHRLTQLAGQTETPSASIVAPTLNTVIVQGDQDIRCDWTLLDFDTVVASNSTTANEVSCTEKELAGILYTSGSTGRPKGVMLSHANVVAGAEIVAEYLNLTAKDRLLAALPLSFDAGLNQLTTAMLVGGTTVMIQFRFGRDIVKTLVQEKITGLAGVPSLWTLLTRPSSGLEKHSPQDLRYVTNTGGALPASIVDQLRQQLPRTDVFLMYGLTEAFRSTYLPPAEIDSRPGSMGKAIPNTEILVVDESGNECAPGEIGELVHHGPTVSLGYWGHPELTDQVLRPHPFPPPGRRQGDLVCYSGDLVRRDEDGFLYFVGRRDHQIKSAGFRISPTEVEDVFCSIAGVRTAAVVGLPDETLGQSLAAAVVLEGDTTYSATELLARVSLALPRHMVPKQVRFVDSIALTPNGKHDYAVVRKIFQDSTLRADDD